MPSDVALYDEELGAVIDEIAGCVRAMETLQGDPRMDKYNRAQELLKKAGRTVHQFNYEVRMLEGAEHAAYEKKGQTHQERLNGLREQLTKKRAEANAVGGGGAAAAAGANGRGDGKDEARQTTKRIAKIQDGTLEAFKRTEKLMADTEDVGQDAAVTLKKQTEDIKAVNEKLTSLDSEVNRAKKELNAFIRRMMSDKIILCFAVMLIVGIIVIVVLRIKHPSAEHVPPPQHPTLGPGQTWAPGEKPSEPPAPGAWRLRVA